MARLLPQVQSKNKHRGMASLGLISQERWQEYNGIEIDWEDNSLSRISPFESELCMNSLVCVATALVFE